MWLVVESRIVIIPLIHKPQVGKPPKKRKKSVDELESQSFSLGKLSRNGKSVMCSKCGNLGHNRQGCKGQDGASKVGGSSQQSQGARQAAGARNVFSQAAGSSQQSQAPRQDVGARNASSQASGSSQQKESNDLNLPDAKAVDPALEASSLPKFDMHLYKSSLAETNVKWLTKCFGIPADLHPRVVSKGMTMDALPNDSIGLYAHYFQQGGLRDKFFLVDRRAAPIAMAWRHHDFSVADPFPKPSEFDASDVAKLREVVIFLRKPPPSLLYAVGLSHAWKHVGRSFSLKDPNGKGNAFVFYRWFTYASRFGPGDPPGPPAGRLEDLPRKTGDMETAEIPCQKVLDDKQKKKKVEAKVAANVPDADIQVEKVASKRGAGKDGASLKRRKVRLETPVHPDSEHVSSPVPLNHAKPLKALANEEHVSINTSASRMDVLRPAVNVDELVLGDGKGQENVDASLVNEGHNDNEGGLSGLRT
ncbi:hypothetical protein Tco_1505927 [Tanacetum coccineum]